MAQKVKDPPSRQETRVRSLGQEDPLEEEMATHSVFLPEKYHGQRSLGYNPWGHKESDVDETTNTFPFSLIFIVPLLCDLEQVT